MLAAQSPAKRAAKAAPVSAVAGVEECQYQVRCAATIPFLRIETSLGIQHAISTKKNWFLMTGSFALSIILFLCFSVFLWAWTLHMHCTVWTLPFGVFGIIFLFVFASAFLSIYAPIKRIQNSPITEILV